MRISKYEEKIKDDKDVLDIFSKIAKEELCIDTLEKQGRDCFDFHDVGVVGLQRALKRAFVEGMKYKNKRKGVKK